MHHISSLATKITVSVRHIKYCLPKSLLAYSMNLQYILIFFTFPIIREGNYMSVTKLSTIVLALSILTACAVTPEQKAAQAKERAQQLLNTQVALAEECNPETAKLMAQMPTVNQLDPVQKKAFENSYTRHINNPAFKTCYNLAWKSYQAQNQVQIAQMQAWDEANALDWENGMFFNDPFGWDNGWGPY